MRKITTPALWIPVAPVTRAMAWTADRGSSTISTVPTRWLRSKARTPAAEIPLTEPLPQLCLGDGGAQAARVTPKNPPASRTPPARAARPAVRAAVRGLRPPGGDSSRWPGADALVDLAAQCRSRRLAGLSSLASQSSGCGRMCARMGDRSTAR